jgi:hypothetical protein
MLKCFAFTDKYFQLKSLQVIGEGTEKVPCLKNETLKRSSKDLFLLERFFIA